MDILIVGAGSIGVFLGTQLHAHNHRVTLLGRRKLRKLNSTILIEDTPFELPTRIYRMPRNKKYDLMLICSKLYDLQSNLQQMRAHKITSEYLVSIQNGIVDPSIYEPYVRGTEFASVSVFEGFRLIENQLAIARTKTGWKTDTSVAGKMICELLGSCGINISTDPAFESVKAEKSVMNCAVNLLSAIHQKAIFELCNDPKLRAQVDELFDEAYDVLSKIVKLRGREALRTLFDKTIVPMRHYSSTYQDAASKRLAEVWFLNGYIVDLGQKYGIPTPASERVLAQFIAMYPKSVPPK